MDGNGSSKVVIHTKDMGGWVRFFTDRPSEEADGLPIFLSHSLTRWFRERPQLTIRCVTPVNRGWISITRPWHLATTNTGLGDPSAATAEKGRKLMDLLTERLAGFLIDLAQAPMDEKFPY